MAANQLRLVLKALKQTWRDYANESSVHGLKYAVGRRRLDRWVWMFIPLISGIAASVMMIIMYRSYFDEPTRAIYETHYAPLKDFDFPAVSICAPRKFTKKSIEYAISKMKFPSNMTSKDIERLIPLLLGFTFPTSLGNRDMRPLDELLTYNQLSPSDVLKLLLPKCDKFLIKCKWEGNGVPCKELFKRAKTKDGYCCSFNYNTEYNNPHFESATSPYFGAGMGLSVIVDTMGIYNKQVFHTMDSFKIMIHTSQEFAGRFVREMVMPLKTELQIAVFPVRIKIGSQAKKLTPEGRKCHNLDEYPLNHFAFYRKSDCLIECEIEKNVNRCGCQSFLYPRNDEDVVCNASTISCLRSHLKQVMSISWGKNCTCPEQCNENLFDIITHTTDLDAVHFNLDPFYNQLTENQTIIHVYAGSEYGTIVKKAIIAYWVDLVSSFGGVFNLFLGCSFLSVVEVLYFAILKFPKAYLKLLRGGNKINVQPFVELK